MLAGQPVEGEVLVDIRFDPGAEFRVLVLPASEPLDKITTGLLSGVPVVEPAQFDNSVVGFFRGRWSSALRKKCT